MREEARHWCHHTVSYADGWGLKSMNNSRWGSTNNFYSLCEEKCARAKLKYCFSYNSVGEFFHVLQKCSKKTDYNVTSHLWELEYSRLSRGRKPAPEVDHLPPSGRILMDIMGCEDVQCPSGGGSSVASMSAAALLSKPAWLMWACLMSGVSAVISYRASKRGQSISCGSPWLNQGKNPLFTLAADLSAMPDILRVKMTLRPLTSQLTGAINITWERWKTFLFFWAAT